MARLHNLCSGEPDQLGSMKCDFLLYQFGAVYHDQWIVTIALYIIQPSSYTRIF